jgi:MFS family permease
MVILDATIVIVALPDQADLAPQSKACRVLSAYALTFGGLFFLGGRAADLLGRRRLFVTGVLLFTVASPARARLSPAALRGPRRPGLGAAIMTPTALSIISTTFPEGSERNKALGIWGALGGVGATAAWLIGGPLVDGPGWEWIFFINIPVGLVALVLSPLLLRESRAAVTRRSYDPAGALTITGALVLLVYALVEAPEVGWADPQTILLLAGSAVLLAAFALSSRATVRPRAPSSARERASARTRDAPRRTVAVGMPFVHAVRAAGARLLGCQVGLSSVVLAVAVTVRAIVASRGRQGRLPAVAATGMALMGRGRSCSHRSP